MLKIKDLLFFFPLYNPQKNVSLFFISYYFSFNFNRNLLYTPSGDVYAFGFIVFEIMTTEQAFSGLTLPQIYIAILNGKKPKIDNYVHETYRKLIERC